ncbi:MAG: class I SAM-dependent methyltransferase [Pseudomonadota bacterium]
MADIAGNYSIDGAGLIEEADVAASTDRYAKRFAGATGTWMISVQTDAIRSLLSDRPVKEVLDVGGGHGQVCPPLLDLGYRVIARVSGPKAMGRLLEIPNENGRFAISQGSLTAMPYPDRSFDAVVSMRTMSHVRDPKGFLAELCRVSRDTVIIDLALDRGRGRFGLMLFALKKLLEGDTRRYALADPDEIAAVLAAEGFEVTGQVGQFVLPMVLHRTLRMAGLSAALERVLRRFSKTAGNPVVLRAVRRRAT